MDVITRLCWAGRPVGEHSWSADGAGRVQEPAAAGGHQSKQRRRLRSGGELVCRPPHSADGGKTHADPRHQFVPPPVVTQHAGSAF